MITESFHSGSSDTQKERAAGAISQRVELHAVMLDSWIRDWADT